ncbi:MAG TPA: hypothetical protein VK638_02270, partial [Edaphobacter sp.]|nr:hypothetical protein [Edaphobacter sp.]
RCPAGRPKDRSAASCGLHPEFTLLPWEEAGNSPLNGSLSFLERAGALPPPQSGHGELEETPTSNPIHAHKNISTSGVSSLTPSCTPELRHRIVEDAKTIQARRGQPFRISTCGQTVLLGR